MAEAPKIVLNNETLTDDYFFIRQVRSVDNFLYIDGQTPSGDSIFKLKVGYENANTFKEQEAQQIIKFIGEDKIWMVNCKKLLQQEKDDNQFNKIYPKSIAELSDRHWTPLHFAKQAAEYLVQKPNTRVLDVGSGVGKFCMIGAQKTNGIFTGVEYRKDLADLSNRIVQDHKIKNCSFINANITNVKFSDYDAVYLFNPFHENIDETAQIDKSFEMNEYMYNIYNQYVKSQLNMMPIGTRLATNWSYHHEIPASFDLKESYYGEVLQFWVKIA